MNEQQQSFVVIRVVMYFATDRDGVIRCGARMEREVGRNMDVDFSRSSRCANAFQVPFASGASATSTQIGT